MRELTIGASAVVAVIFGAFALAGCKVAQTDTSVQGWDATQQGAWSNADQGSRLMPLSWFKALEQPDLSAPQPNTPSKPFLDTTYLAGFRILPPVDPAKNILPVGFAADTLQDDGGLVNTSLHWLGQPSSKDYVPWVGLTCAACHTSQYEYAGKSWTVWGAPSLFDFQSFIEAVDTALAQTRAAAQPGAVNTARWDRFASGVLGKDDTPTHRQNLTAALDKLIAWEGKAETLNQTDLRYGYGRVDAIGHIFNRILMFGGADQPSPNAADAPVSFPHLWNITLETKVQWDGITSNVKFNPPGGQTPSDFGALGRNVGEVLGVFGESVPRSPASALDLGGFVSSIHVDTLNALEVQLTKLKSPVWPNEFGQPGAIDVTDASGHKLTPADVLKAGAALFATNCQDCHTSHIPTGGTYETMKTFAELTPTNQTDEWMACNAWSNLGYSGSLTGVPLNYTFGAKTPALAPVNQLLATTVKASLVHQAPQVAQAAIENAFGITPLPKAPRILLARPLVALSAKQQRLNKCMANASDPLMAYKARPLEGIWATAPYLHNGSVPTLYDLLLPPDQRPKTFVVGTRSFDPKKVGYDTNPVSAGNSFSFDTSLPGNSNKGHVYGVGGLSDTQRRELLEYLKSL